MVCKPKKHFIRRSLKPGFRALNLVKIFPLWDQIQTWSFTDQFQTSFQWFHTLIHITGLRLVLIAFQIGFRPGFNTVSDFVSNWFQMGFKPGLELVLDLVLDLVSDFFWNWFQTGFKHFWFQHFIRLSLNPAFTLIRPYFRIGFRLKFPPIFRLSFSLRFTMVSDRDPVLCLWRCSVLRSGGWTLSWPAVSLVLWSSLRDTRCVTAPSSRASTRRLWRVPTPPPSGWVLAAL